MTFKKIGSLTLPRTISSAIPFFDTEDMNGDGSIDLVFHAVSPLAFTSTPPDTAYTEPTILLRSGNAFVDGTSSVFGNTPYKAMLPSAMRIADFNGDGISDLFTSDYGIDPYDNKSTVKTGAPEFLALTGPIGKLYSAPLPSPVDSVTHSNAIADIDNDGDLDILLLETVLGVNSKSASAFLVNRGNGEFDYKTDLLPKNAYLPAAKFTSGGFGDINGDGKADLVLGVAHSTYDSIAIINPGDGNFSKGTQIKLPLGLFSSPVTTEAQKVAAATTIVLAVIVADFDRDGKNDIAMAETWRDPSHPEKPDYRGASIQLIMNRDGILMDETSSRISNLSITNNYNHFYDMSAVDVDGDRDLDLIAYRAENGTGRSGYSTNIFTNDGTGRFTQNNLGMPSDGLLIPLAKDNLPAQAFVHLDYYIVGSSGKYGVWNPVATLWRKDANGVDYIGQGKSDDIKGSSQSDRFSGMGGNDNFNGGSGVDTTQFRGKRSEYNIQISTNFDAVNVTDLTSSRDGNDQLQDIERLWFTDKTLAIDINGNAGQAYRLYQAALDRTPDERGLAGWIKFMDDGGALTTMAQQFIDSQEFRTKYGALDDRNFVNQLYLNVLDRNGEAAGITGWVNGLANGLTRADVLKGFSESSENQANVIGQIKNGISYQEWWLS